MKNTIKGLAFAGMIALSLLVSSGSAFAKDAKQGRETAWTDLPVPQPVLLGVTWETFLAPIVPIGVTWEE